MFKTKYLSDQTFCDQPLNYDGYFYIPTPNDKSISVAIYKDRKQPLMLIKYNKLFKSLENMKYYLLPTSLLIYIFKKRNTEPRS